MDRSARRELGFKLLYSLEIQKASSEELVTLFIENNAVEEENVKEYLLNLANGVQEHIEEINEKIETNLKKDWELKRISKIDISLLKLAIYEIMYQEIPFKVVINEVVELAKKYGEEQSPSFINGMLANIIKEN